MRGVSSEGNRLALEQKLTNLRLSEREALSSLPGPLRLILNQAEIRANFQVVVLAPDGQVFQGKATHNINEKGQTGININGEIKYWPGSFAVFHKSKEDKRCIEIEKLPAEVTKQQLLAHFKVSECVCVCLYVCVCSCLSVSPCVSVFLSLSPILLFRLSLCLAIGLVSVSS